MLTSKQHELLLFINKRLNETGVSPSFDEMREALDLKSKSGVHRLISALEERGFIRRLPNRARALEVLKLPESAAPAPSAPRPVVPAAASVPGHVPYVLDENVVRLGGGEGFPLEEIAQRLARALGEAGTPLAARLPVLRPAVCDELIRRFSRRNAVVGVAVFVPGADLPILTLNQIRLILLIADAHGFEIDRERIPEVVAVIGSGLGFRALARRSVGLVPFVGWAVKGGFAYAGTRAIGEASVRYFERRAPVTKVAGERVRF